ncbi:MAG: hypothetical protein L0154_20910 [Chloroflexi bacterium]|nr:hypothetical protein [Chloroflexota bacterium]
MNTTIFELQLYLLDQLERDAGQVDCIFLGSSIVLQGINPAVVEAAYRAQTDEEIQCFTFGITGLVGQSAGLVAPILVERYQPRLLIYGTSPREFAARMINEATLDINENSWIEYKNGNFNWQGFFIEHSAAYRYYLRYQDWLSPDFEEILNRFTNFENLLTDDGHLPNFNMLFDVNIPAVPGNVAEERPIFRRLSDFQPNERDVNGVEAIARLEQDTATRVVILEIPTHSSFVNYFDNGLEGYNEFTVAMQDLSNRYNVPFWQPRHLNLIPDEFWTDRTHMNANGALIFSDWLGTQLGLAAEVGLLDEEIPENLLTATPAPDMPPQDIATFYDNPFGLSDVASTEYPQFDSYRYIPEGVVIFDPDDTPGDLRLYRYNIGGNIARLDDPAYRRQSFEVLHLLGRIQQFDDFPADVQPALQAWRDTGDASYLKQAGIDYLMIPSVWLMLQADTLVNPQQLEFVREWKHWNIGVVYHLYRIR